MVLVTDFLKKGEDRIKYQFGPETIWRGESFIDTQYRVPFFPFTHHKTNYTIYKSTDWMAKEQANRLWGGRDTRVDCEEAEINGWGQKNVKCAYLFEMRGLSGHNIAIYLSMLIATNV